MYFKNFLACAGLLVASNVSDVSFASCNCDDDGDVKCGASKCDNCDNKGKTGSFDELLLPKLLPRLYVGILGHGGLNVSKLGLSSRTKHYRSTAANFDNHYNGFGGCGPVIGLEKIFFKHLYTSVEVDASWSNSPHPNNYAKSPIAPFSWGLSGRLGLQLGRGTIIYALVGLETNKISAKDTGTPHYRKRLANNIIDNPTFGDNTVQLIVRNDFFLTGNERKQHLRLGFGFEHYVWDYLRLRTELLWTLEKRYNVSSRATFYRVRNFNGGYRETIVPTWSHTSNTKFKYSKYQIKLGAIWAFNFGKDSFADGKRPVASSSDASSCGGENVQCASSECYNNKGSFDELLLPKLLPRLYVGILGHGGLAVSKLGLSSRTKHYRSTAANFDNHYNGFGGCGPVIGLEKIFFKHLYTSVEIDASWSNSPHPNNYAKSPIDPFSCGVSGRLGLQLGRGTIIYALVGLENNKISAKDTGTPHYRKRLANNIIDVPAFTNNRLQLIVRNDFFLTGNESKQHLRLGFGFEHYVWDHLRLRTELLWTLEKRYNVSSRATFYRVTNNNGYREELVPTWSHTSNTKFKYSKYQIKLGAIWAF